MNSRIKHLYNQMNEHELTKQYDYLKEYLIENLGKLTIIECKEITTQRRYIKGLLNSLLIYQVKEYEKAR